MKRSYFPPTIAGVLAATTGAVLGGFVAVPGAVAQTRTECQGGLAPVATVVALDGAVEVTAADGSSVALAIGLALCPGDAISTGEDGRVELRFSALDTTVGLSRISSLRLPAAGDTEANIDMDSGLMRFLSSVRRFFVVRTRHVNAGIDGTEAVIAVDGPLDDSLFVVQEGDVTLTERRRGGVSMTITRDQAGFFSQNTGLVLATTSNVPAKFHDLVADPAGASDWAIYFPPVLLATGAPAAAMLAAARLRAGDPDGAEALLAGRTDAASLALGAVVAVLRNRTEEGAGLAARAVAADPGLSAAHVAQSYALQAQGQIDAAAEAAARAVTADPGDANARARLAELLLTEGDRAGALAAIALIPPADHTALSRAVEGLAALSANDPTAANAAFAQAIALDSEAPLPRLGLGLAMIKAGDVAGGRRELELAAALDPRRASLRTWLGRAYAEEGLADKAASQFAEAKSRDPDDPTPWLFSARQKFDANRPIEALGDLRAAEARGQGRSVVRSEAGLGEDRAVRGAALGRVNQVLGFDDQAVVAGTGAAEADPTNPAAHYLLADVLGVRPGREASRASALLQAQIYDPPGKTAIRPQLSETDMAFLETPGAARASFAEFAPFFDSDGVSVEVTGSIGNNDTFGDEASLTGLIRGFSIGVGQFHYETDGLATNNAVRHDIVSVQGRAAVAPWLDIFAEFRIRDTSSGDRALEFDLTLANPTTEIEDERHLARLGFHAELGADHDLAGVFTYAERDAFLTQTDEFLITAEERRDREALELQLQHVGRFGALTTVSGLAYAEADTTRATDLFIFGFPFFSEVVDGDLEHFGAYGYVTWRLGNSGPAPGTELTVGLSVESYDDGLPLGRDQVEVNPKAGARVALSDTITLRGAYTRSVTPGKTLEQRLEPATVAGFAQFFDTFEGSIVEQAAVGGDLRLLPWLTVGGEAAWRWIDSPINGVPADAKTEEREFRGYANATLGKRIAATLELTHERATSDNPGDLTEFEATELHGGVSYFHPDGFFVSAGAGYVWHEFSGFGRSGSDRFPVTEFAIGYRLPDQRGMISLEVHNALDKSFEFEDRPLQSLQNPTATPRYAREFTVIGRVTLSF